MQLLKVDYIANIIFSLFVPYFQTYSRGIFFQISARSHLVAHVFILKISTEDIVALN